MSGPFDALPGIRAHQIFDGITARPVHGERITMAVVELDPGAVVAEHSHENEQLGIVLRGALTLRVGGEERALGPGETWCIAPNVAHSGHAGPEGAVVIDVFSLPRHDWEELDRLGARRPRWP
jgi:quercetin dioxygenase-like cupin family protein